MAVADRTNSTEQLQRFINDLWQHQPKNGCCGFTLITNDTSIDCHKLVLSSASSYFSQLLYDSEHNTNSIDVTPLPEHILRTIVAFMYDSEYVIDDENVVELLELSGTWKLDILTQLCVTYMDDNITINNACRFYNFALDNNDQHKSQVLNRFIREHFTSLHESGQLSELTLKNFTSIIEHDEINVKNEDVIFSSAMQIINQRTPVEDINRCLELIRFPHMSGLFFVSVILDHQLLKNPPRDKYRKEAILYHMNKAAAPEIKPPRYWGRGVYYVNKSRSLYQLVFRSGNHEYIKMTNLPGWADTSSSLGSDNQRVVIVRPILHFTRAMLVDITDSTKITQLPNLPEPLFGASVVLSNNDVYVVGGYSNDNGSLCSVYYLSLGSDAWQTKKSMPHKVYNPLVYNPLVIKHQQCIYVLGRINKGTVSSVSQYNIEDDTWNNGATCHQHVVTKLMSLL